MDLLTDTPVVPRPRVPIDMRPARQYSTMVPREYIAAWPERTDCCPNCLHESGHLPITEELRGVKIVSAYHCRLCDHTWVTTYRVEG